MDSDLVAKVRDSSRSFVRELGFLEDDSLKLGMKHTQCHMMLELEREGFLLVNDLSEALCVDKAAISRHAQELIRLGWIEAVLDPEDKRRKPLRLTAIGLEQMEKVHKMANHSVWSALSLLPESQRQSVANGLKLYANALTKSRKAKDFTVRPVREVDNIPLAQAIRTVMVSVGLNQPGTAYSSPELQDMYASYQMPGTAYFVVVGNGKVMGGSGIAPLEGVEGCCSLNRMYLLPEARGYGQGQALLSHCIEAAKSFGYTTCYAETLSTMKNAQRLYENNGFTKKNNPLGNTGYYTCDVWYTKHLLPS